MKIIKLRLKERSYNIVVGDNILGSLGGYLKRLNIGKDACVITTPVINAIWGPKLSSSLRRAGFRVRFEEVADTEKSKSAKTCLALLDRVALCGRAGGLFIIAFGGGVVGDLSGFVAAIYKRGVPYVQVPTTLVAQVDSSIGGKVALDLKTGKNLVGAFYQPRLVFSETRFLQTLPDKQLRNGLSEIIKYGVINDSALFEFLEKNSDKMLRLEKSALGHIIERSSRIKAAIVERDEFDRLGIRALLNYGHTIGHAIEAAGGYSSDYSHGMAISAGMVAANFIAKELGLISDHECRRIEGLLRAARLPVVVKNISPRKIYDAHLYDKKFIHGKNRFVLPVAIGKARAVSAVPEVLVKKAIDLISGR